MGLQTQPPDIGAKAMKVLNVKTMHLPPFSPFGKENSPCGILPGGEVIVGKTWVAVLKKTTERAIELGFDRVEFVK